MASEINHRMILVSGGGGVLDMISPEGEIVASIHVPAGRVRAAHYTELLQPGYRLEIAEGLVAFPPRSRVSITHHPGATKTDANPYFKPTYASALERDMRVRMIRQRQASTREARRDAAAQDVLRRRKEAEEAEAQQAAKAAADEAAAQAARIEAARLAAQAAEAARVVE